MLRGHSEFALKLFGITMQTELVDVQVGGFEGVDLFCGEVGWQAVLPELVFAFNSAPWLGESGHSGWSRHKNLRASDV